MSPGQLLERESELSELEDLAAEVLAGSGRTIVVEGRPGVGKSTLITEGLSLAARHPALRTVSFRCGELEQELSWAAVTGLLGRLVADRDDAAADRLFTGAAAPARRLFTDPARADAAEADGYGMIHALLTLVAALAADAPLLVLLDDAHWADRPSLQFLAYLQRRLADLAVGLVVAMRPPQVGVEPDLLERIATGPDTRIQSLLPLGADSVTALVHAQGFPQAGPGFCQACWEVTAGNPFYLHELLLELREDGVDPGAGTAELMRFPPPSVMRSVLVRLGRLHSPRAGDLARATATVACSRIRAQTPRRCGMWSGRSVGPTPTRRRWRSSSGCSPRPHPAAWPWPGRRPCYARSRPHYWMARVDDAARDARTAIEIWQGGLERYLPAAIYYLGLAELERGDQSAAAAALALAEPAERWQGTGMLPFLIGLEGHLHLHAGRLVQAAATQLACGEALNALLVTSPAVMAWRSQAALALRLNGERARARELLDDELQRALATGGPRPIGVALRVSGLCRGGSAGVAQLRESVTALDGSGVDLEFARSLVELGAAVCRQGQPRAARPHLERALEILDGSGSRVAARRADTELRAAGGRGRAQALSGAPALTASERRVAELAADGHTNRHIAALLQISVKAVEWHLHQSYRKLDIDGRRQLADALAA